MSKKLNVWISGVQYSDGYCHLMWIQTSDIAFDLRSFGFTNRKKIVSLWGADQLSVVNQDSANNSTPLRYSSKTCCFGNYSYMNLLKIRPSYWTWVRFEYLYFRRKWHSCIYVGDKAKLRSWRSFRIKLYSEIFCIVFPNKRNTLRV